jgi:hypothetical protein
MSINSLNSAVQILTPQTFSDNNIAPNSSETPTATTEPQNSTAPSAERPIAGFVP